MKQRESWFLYILILSILVGCEGTLTTPSSSATQRAGEHEPDSIPYVAAAFNELFSASSYHLSSRQRISLDAPNFEQSVETISEVDVIFESSEIISPAAAFEGTVEQRIVNNSDPEVRVTMAIVFFGDDYVIDLVETNGVCSELLDIAPDARFSPRQVERCGINFSETVAGLFDKHIRFPISLETVAFITEVAPEELDGQNLRVFDLEFDLQSLLETGEASQLFGDDLNPELMALFQESHVTMRAWINRETGLLYQHASTMNLSAEIEAGESSVHLTFNADVQFTHTKINQIDEIKAPTNATNLNDSTPTDIELSETFTTRDGKLSFQYPAGWTVLESGQSSEGVLILSSSTNRNDLIKGVPFPSGELAISFMIFPRDIAEPNAFLNLMQQSVTAEYGAEADIEVVRDVTMGDYPALAQRVSVEDGQMEIVLIQRPDVLLVMLSVSAPDEMESLFGLVVSIGETIVLNS